MSNVYAVAMEKSGEKSGDTEKSGEKSGDTLLVREIREKSGDTLLVILKRMQFGNLRGLQYWHDRYRSQRPHDHLGLRRFRPAGGNCPARPQRKPGIPTPTETGNPDPNGNRESGDRESGDTLLVICETGAIWQPAGI
jgi:hypothetical protein